VVFGLRDEQLHSNLEGRSGLTEFRVVDLYKFTFAVGLQQGDPLRLKLFGLIRLFCISPRLSNKIS
jgi:hypothetical protein